MSIEAIDDSAAIILSNARWDRTPLAGLLPSSSLFPDLVAMVVHAQG